MVKGGTGQWSFQNWQPASVKPPNAQYVYQRQSTPTSQVIDQNIGQGYRYGTSNSPQAQRQQQLQQAQANLNRIKQAGRPQWQGRDMSNNNAEYQRMNPVSGYSGYQADLSRNNAQRSKAQEQVNSMRGRAGMQSAAPPTAGRANSYNHMQQQPHQQQPQQSTGGIASLSRNKMAGPTRWR